MKHKVLLSLLLAVVMLFTLAAPALAKPIKGTLTNFLAPAEATGKYSHRVTRDNYFKVTVAIVGGLPNTEHTVSVYSSGLSNPDGIVYQEVVGVFTTNSGGRGRLSGFATIDGVGTGRKEFTTGDWLIDIRVTANFDLQFNSDNDWVTFD